MKYMNKSIEELHELLVKGEVTSKELIDESLELSHKVQEECNSFVTILDDAKEVPITDIVNNIILDGIKRKASDIHFDPYEKGLRIRMRIDGSLMDYSHVPLYIQKNMITRIKIII